MLQHHLRAVAEQHAALNETSVMSGSLCHAATRASRGARAHRVAAFGRADGAVASGWSVRANASSPRPANGLSSCAAAHINHAPEMMARTQLANRRDQRVGVAIGAFAQPLGRPARVGGARGDNMAHGRVSANPD